MGYQASMQYLSIRGSGVSGDIGASGDTEGGFTNKYRVGHQPSIQ